MPLYTRARRWQPPFYPFKREPMPRRLLAALERSIKGPLFGCRMCGNCLLQETAMICHMQCPKGMRNGPCGGSMPDKCYVDETRPCIWTDIYARSFALGREDKLLEVLPPVDWDKVGTETWWDVAQQVRKVGIRKVASGLTSRNPLTRSQTWDEVFVPVRQPTWWQGDSVYHPPAYTEPISQLERRLRAGEFVVTAEIGPPMSVMTDKLERTLQSFKPCVAAVNFTDNASAMPRMSSAACSAIAVQHGLDPVFQMAAREHTRMGIQSDIIGANALGIRNVLCLTGDHSRTGAVPYGRSDILDLDAIQMLWILRRMRDEGKYLDGRALTNPPRVFLGAAASPFASKPQFQALREQKKVNAGAQFFQTNCVFDLAGFEIWLDALAKRGVLDKVFILVGIAPLKSLKMAQYMNDRIPGVHIPEAILKRMEDAGDGAMEEGYQVALELIEGVKALQAVHGIHLMAVGWEAVVPRLVEAAGIMPEGKADLAMS